MVEDVAPPPDRQTQTSPEVGALLAGVAGAAVTVGAAVATGRLLVPDVPPGWLGWVNALKNGTGTNAVNNATIPVALLVGYCRESSTGQNTMFVCVRFVISVPSPKNANGMPQQTTLRAPKTIARIAIGCPFCP